MQNEEKNTVCKFCLKSCEYSFEDVEAVTKEMLGILGLYLDIHNGKSIICKACSASLQKCFDFKTVCMYTEDYINSFRKDVNNAKLDLTDIYLRKIGNKNTTVSKCHAVCRLCMEIAEPNCCICLDDETNDVVSAKTILRTWFSDLDLEVTNNPVICTSCNESLRRYFSFIKSCLRMEDKIEKYCETKGSSSKLHVKSNSMLPFEAENASSYLNSYTNIDILKNCKGNILHNEITLEPQNLMQKGSQELYIKHEVNEHEEIDDVEAHVKVEKFSGIAENYGEEKQYGETILKCENSVGTESYGFSIEHEEIDIKTEEKGTDWIEDNSLKLDNMLIHKNSSDVTMYLCEICAHKTKRKDHLKQHMLIHKNSAEFTMYSCEICAYKAKRKDHLKQHMLIHKNSLDVLMYLCDICTYKTKKKSCLKRHMLIHKHSSEVTMYSCEICVYKTKRKGHLKRHMVKHKNTLEATPANTLM